MFSGQLYVMINNMEAMQWNLENTAILGGNVVLVLGVFLVAYKKAFA